LSQQYEGRLELTWTNKALRLLAHEDGLYEWVPPADYRVAEVRLLDNAGTVGETRSDRARAKDNLLLRGDALNALTSLAELPEFARELVGKVKLAYLDPPFNTQQSWLHYDDALEHSVWLTMMRDRLAQIRKLLSPDGSVWVHCDDSEMAYLRVAMDEMLGRQNFIGCVVWKRRNDTRNTAMLSANHDYILIYARDIEQAEFNLLPRTDEMDARYTNPDKDKRGPWLRGNLNARNFYSKGLYPITAPGGRQIDGPPAGSFWRVSEEKFRELDADKRIYWGADGNSLPYIKRFLSEVQNGRVPNTVWEPEEVGFVRQGKNEGRALLGHPFDTPKPEKLMGRIITLASNPGDIVLDCFLGSGTTAAVAQKMGRRWVGVERSGETIDTFVLPRLTKVTAGEDPGGITEEAGWQGGSGFRVLDVAPSMFAEDGGVVLLADWAVNGRLAEATAAQLHYDYEPDPPFCGRRGRTRLAVIDGLISEGVAQLLVGALAEDERLVVCGTALDPQISQTLRDLRRGCTARRIPSSILAEYRDAPRWSPQALEGTEDGAALGTDVPAGENGSPAPAPAS
jgi:adenine-specific DNA-methyltransferase